MSKIGKINIAIPEKVKVVLNGNLLNIEGPLGKKSLNIDISMFDLIINEGKSVSIKQKSINQDTKRLWGMHRSLLNNAIIGTSSGYSKIFVSIFKTCLPSGPSTFNKLPFRIIFTFSGIAIFILPIFDIKIPYKLFLHLLFAFVHQYHS